MCLPRTKGEDDGQRLVTDLKCSVCDQFIHDFELHSYRLNKCVFNRVMPMYLAFVWSLIFVNVFQGAVTVGIFIKYCRDIVLYRHFLSLNPTSKDQIFFTAINFIVMIESFSMMFYDIYRTITVVAKIIRHKRYLKTGSLMTKRPVKSGIKRSETDRVLMSVQIKEDHVLTERPLLSVQPKQGRTPDIRPQKFRDFPYSLRVGQQFIRSL